MHRLTKWLTIALVALPLASASAQDEESSSDEDSAGRVCVNSRAVRNFDAITDQHVYVQEGSSRHFLFTMRNRCFGLRNSMGIALKDTTSRICSDGFGEIVYRDRMSSQRLQSCRIGKIEVVDSKEDARAKVEAAKDDD